MHSKHKACKTFLTVATSKDLSEIEDLRQRNIEFHKPWVYHGDIKLLAEKIETGRTIALLARSSSDESLVGVVNLNEPVRGALQSAYLGYYVDKKRAGQGFMTEALHLSVEYAFQRLDFHRLEANIQPGNVLSIALVKRLGFRLEGFSPKYLRINETWCDHERWAIISDERSNENA